MTPPSPSTTTQNSNTKNGAAAQAAPAPAPAPQPEKSSAKTKPVTINIADDLHRKLRIVALSKGSTTSGLVESYVENALKRDLAVALSKLTEE